MEDFFVHNKIYKRTDIQDKYGGNRQGGIAVCAKFPFILIFSGEAGHKHGYKDQWENDKVFSYTGEGRYNDMEFIRGNLALRDHMLNGKRVFLYKYVSKGFVRFESELELLTIDYFQGPDSAGKERNAIKFFFKRVGVIIDYPIEQIKTTDITASNNKLSDTPKVTEREGLVTSRVGQGAYRKSILFRWEFKCAVTSYTKKEILIASHIVPWKISTCEERLDVDNGILLSPIYDALFDQHLISFENSGKIILSQSLSNTNYGLIGVDGNEKIRNLSTGNIPYLERHREKLLELQII